MDQPVFSVTEGVDPAFQLHRVAYGAIFEDGSLAVVNGGASQLVILDAGGRARRIAGSPGLGPGELGSVNGLFFTADGVAASEARPNRLTFFSQSGEFEGTLTMEGASSSLIVGIGPDTTVVTVRFRPPPGQPRVYQIWNQPRELIREIYGPREPPLATMVYPGALPHSSGRPITVNRTLDAECFARIDQVLLGEEVYALDASAGAVIAIDYTGSAREIFRVFDVSRG